MKRSPVSAGPSVEALPQRHDALVVLDVDEVVLHFIAPFQTLLNERGARLHFDSFKLTGNIRSISTGAALTGHELDQATEQLYREQEHRQAPVDGAVEAVTALRERSDVVFLTAMDPAYYDERRRLLDRHGLDAPMIATERSKGAFVAEFRRRWRGAIVFADDIPPNLEGVRRSVPDVHLLHLMANPDFRPHLPPLPAGAASAANWGEARATITALIGA